MKSFISLNSSPYYHVDSKTGDIHKKKFRNNSEKIDGFAPHTKGLKMKIQ